MPTDRQLLAGCLALFCVLLPRAVTAAAAPSPEQLEGIYVYRAGSSHKEVHVAYMGKGKAKVSFDLSLSGASPAIGTLAGDATIVGDVATYRNGACAIAMRFEPGNRLNVTQTGSPADCGFGNRVTADGEYAKTRGGQPSVTIAPQDAPPPAHTADELRAVATRAQKEAAGAKAHIEEKRPRIDELAAERQKALADVTAKKNEFEKQARAANAAFKKWQAAAGKANAKPSAAELAAAADEEHQKAIGLGTELLDARLSLRKIEDELAQVVADAGQSATDADADVKDIRDATQAAGKLGSASSKGPVPDDVTKLKTELRTILTQTQTSARSAHSAATTAVARAHFSAKGYGTKRAKDEKDDGTLNDRIAALQKQRDGLKA
ncbi:MAG TPA: hypothetical protein VHC69_21460 [Polyangiaceae bacterium]|nr:hypothetical protein [Polyangiaceae bacterium]